MSKPFDATSKDLAEMEPSAWTTVVGKPRAAHLVRCVDADIKRFDTEATKPLAAKLWSATYVLMGLRFESAFSEQLLQGVIAMEESTTYKAIIAKGEAKGKLEEIRKAILRLGIKRFGNADAGAETTLNNLTDLEILEHILERIYDVESWQELLQDT